VLLFVIMCCYSTAICIQPAVLATLVEFPLKIDNSLIRYSFHITILLVHSCIVCPVRPWNHDCIEQAHQWRTQEFCSGGRGWFNKFSWGQRERGSGGGSPL